MSTVPAEDLSKRQTSPRYRPDILERAKKALIDDDMTYEDYDECISLLIAEVERLRSENDGLKELVDCMLLLVHSEVNSYDKLSRLSIKAHETIMEAWQVQCEKAIAKDVRIKELSDLNELLMENGNNLRTRCQKAESRIKELEARLAEIEEDGDCLTAAYLLGGKKKADENKVLIAYVERLEAAFLDHLAARLYYEHYPGVSDAYSWHDYPEDACQMRPKEMFRQKAREALEEIKAETGSGDHVAGANKLILTAEQREEEGKRDA